MRNLSVGIGRQNVLDEQNSNSSKGVAQKNSLEIETGSMSNIWKKTAHRVHIRKLLELQEATSQQSEKEKDQHDSYSHWQNVIFIFHGLLVE